MASQEGKKVLAADVDAPKSPAPAPAGSDTGDHLKLPLAADQDPDATVPQVGSGDEEVEMLVRGKKNKDDASGSGASGSSAKKPRAEDLFPVAATVQAAAGVAPLGAPLVSSSARVLPSVVAQLPFAATGGLRPPPRRPIGVPYVSPAAAAATFFGPITEEQDRISKIMEDDDFVLRAAISRNWRPKEKEEIFLPPNDANRLKICIKCNTNPATAASLPINHICLCHVCYEECLADPLSTSCAHCFAAAFAQIKRD